MKRVAVVGAGVFGVTVAVDLARAGLGVTLFERKTELLWGASGTNLYRLHRGYHYPRDRDTAAGTNEAEGAFRERYSEAVVTGEPHYYGIAAEGTLTTVPEFEAFCEQIGLELTPEYPEVVRAEGVAACYRVPESRYDPAALRLVCGRQLAEAGVEVRLGTEATEEELDAYDFRVLTSYAHLNELTSMGELQFEVCEIPIVRLGPAYAGKSVVILDGPFMSFDPIGGARHALYHVDLSIHCRTVGAVPEVPVELRAVLDAGLVDASARSRFPEIRARGQEFFDEFEPEYLGSMFALRAVLPNVEDTDARPTIIRRVDNRTTAVFSGKVVTAVQAAATVTATAVEAVGALRPEGVR